MTDIFPYFTAAKSSLGYKIFAGIITVLALIEFFLFTLSFLYVLVRTAAAQSWGGRSLALGVGIFFAFTRLFCLVLLVANVPLPGSINSVGNPRLISGSLWALGIFFFVILFVQMAIVVTHECIRLYRRRTRANPLATPDHRKSLLAVIVPIYNESPKQLWETIVSVIENKYPHDKLNLILAFDDYSESDLYLGIKKVIEADLSTLNVSESAKRDSRTTLGSFTFGESHVIEYRFRGATLTLCRFAHGGKRATQNKAFAVAEHWYKEVSSEYENVPFPRDPKKHQAPLIPELVLLFIDSDVVLHRLCIPYMEQAMREYPFRRAITGLILCSIPKSNLLWVLQEIEYVQAQMIDRVVESAMGGVTCLPGALTMVRYHALKSVAPLYFGWKTTDLLDTFEYSKYYLGEDRYLTSLLLDSTSTKKEISFCEDAMSETIAPGSFKTFMRQRRRWFLGTLANEAQLLTSPRSYRIYPVLTLYRLLMTSMRSITLLYYVLIVSIISDRKPIWALVCAIVVPILFNWIAVGYYGVTLRSYSCLLYPVFHVIFPIYQWIVTVYSILTCKKHTWGGPRVIPASKVALHHQQIIDVSKTDIPSGRNQYDSTKRTTAGVGANYPSVYLEPSAAYRQGKYTDMSFTSISDTESVEYTENVIRDNSGGIIVDVSRKSESRIVSKYFDEEYNKDVFYTEYVPQSTSNKKKRETDSSSVQTITRDPNADSAMLAVVEDIMGVNGDKRQAKRVSMMARMDEFDDSASSYSNTSASTITPGQSKLSWDTDSRKEQFYQNYSADGFNAAAVSIPQDAATTTSYKKPIAATSYNNNRHESAYSSLLSNEDISNIFAMNRNESNNPQINQNNIREVSKSKRNNIPAVAIPKIDITVPSQLHPSEDVTTPTAASLTSPTRRSQRLANRNAYVDPAVAAAAMASFNLRRGGTPGSPQLSNTTNGYSSSPTVKRRP